MATGALLLLLLVGVTLGHMDMEAGTHRLENQQARLNNLKEEFTDFKSRFDTKMDESAELEAAITEYKRRMTRVEPSGCNDLFEMQCGGKHDKCLSRLLICDTHDDCDNGFDESQCDTYTPSGSRWSGSMTYNHCTENNAEYIDMYIENYRTVDYFRPYPEVTAELELRDSAENYVSSQKFTLEGWMDLKPFNHVLYLRPPADKDLVFTCEFDGIHPDHCYGTFTRRISDDVCAEFYLERQDRYHTD